MPRTPPTPWQPADEGQTIQVRVTFTDDAGNEESLTSVATGEVAAGGPTDPPGQPGNLTGIANGDGTVTLSWDAPDDDTVTGYRILRRRPSEGERTLLVHVNDTGSIAAEYTDNDVIPGVVHVYRVKAINAVGLSRQSEFVNLTPVQPAEPAQNSVATGRPSITGTAQVGETLAAHTADIGDADGLDNVTYSYQWLASDGGADIDIRERHGFYLHPGSQRRGPDHPGSRVTFTDDAGNEETLTSVATEAVSFAVQQQQANTPAHRHADDHRHGPGGGDAGGAYLGHRGR